MEIAFTILFGLIIGSFLSVCIFRIPASRDDIMLNPFDEDGNERSIDEAKESEKPSRRVTFTDPPRSLCPECGEQILWYHNIPVLSWIALKGRCAFCSTSISSRYPIVELLTAILALLTFSHFGFTATAVVIFAFLCALLVISVIDIDYYIIPDIISKPGMLLGALVVTINHFTGWFVEPIAQDIWSGVYGFIAGYGFLWAFASFYFWLRKKDGLGLGDIKLLGMTGILFGPESAIYTIFLGSVLGSIIGLTSLLVVGRKFAKPLPFGPYLALGTFLYIFYREEVLEIWISIMSRTLVPYVG